MIDTEKLVDFLCREKISANQYLLLRLLHESELEVKKGNLSYSTRGLLYKYYVENPDCNWTVEEVEDLEKKGFIINYKTLDLTSPNPEDRKYDYEKIILTAKFSDYTYVGDEAFMEIWDIYPKFIKVDGATHPARNVDPDEFGKEYLKIIKKDRQQHEKVKEIVKYLSSKSLIKKGLGRFIRERDWEAWEEEYHKYKANDNLNNNGRVSL